MNLHEFQRNSFLFKNYKPNILVAAGTISYSIVDARYCVIGAMVTVFIQVNFNISVNHLSIGVTMPSKVKGVSGSLPSGAFSGLVQGGSGTATTGMITLFQSPNILSVARSNLTAITTGAGGSISGMFFYQNGE